MMWRHQAMTGRIHCNIVSKMLKYKDLMKYNEFTIIEPCLHMSLSGWIP